MADTLHLKQTLLEINKLLDNGAFSPEIDVRGTSNIQVLETQMGKTKRERSTINMF